MQYPSECLKQGNEVHFWRLCGHGVCMVDHCKTKTAEVPAAFESFQVHGQFPNQNSLHRCLYIFELSRLRSFRESAWLQFRRTPMPLCKPCVDETGRNRKKPRKCIRYFHMISQLVQSFVLVDISCMSAITKTDIHRTFITCFDIQQQIDTQHLQMEGSNLG